MNKDELLKEFNDKVEDLRQELLEKLEKEEKKGFEVKIPYNLEDYYVTDKCGGIYSTEEYLDAANEKVLEVKILDSIHENKKVLLIFVGNK